MKCSHSITLKKGRLIFSSNLHTFTKKVKKQIQKESIPGISRTPDPASRDEENLVRTHGFGKRRVPGRRVFLS